MKSNPLPSKPLMRFRNSDSKRKAKALERGIQVIEALLDLRLEELSVRLDAGQMSSAEYVLASEATESAVRLLISTLTTSLDVDPWKRDRDLRIIYAALTTPDERLEIERLGRLPGAKSNLSSRPYLRHRVGVLH